MILLSYFAQTEAQNDTLSKDKPYPFKSAIIEYTISGSLQKGKEILYIDDWGRKTATERHTTMNIFGRTQKEDTLEIDNGEKHYRIDLTTKEMTVSPSYAKRAEQMLKTMSTEQKQAMEQSGRETLAKLSPETVAEKKPKKGTLLGKECDIFEIPELGVTSWQWNGITLKMKQSMLGDMQKEATSLKIDCPISADRFAPPKEIVLPKSSIPGVPNPQPSKQPAATSEKAKRPSGAAAIAPQE
jgi:hypothetical protein